MPSPDDDVIDEPDVEISVGDSDTPEAVPDGDPRRDGDADDGADGGGADDAVAPEPAVRQNLAEIWLWMDIRTGHW